ncbi:phage terminase large subunit [Brevibacillus borstelensis]|uniref:phage terminase large subunit n=1 Tax=Brevibacillus borstelensis TaxID=45462 RepID=UPI002E1DA290|nr:phage terminase large subunit [Brevibacillus borstelensis]
MTEKKQTFLQSIVGGDENSQVEDWEHALWDEYAKRFPSIRHLKGKKPFTGPSGLRRMLGEKCMEYFGRAYFPEYIPLPPPPFHVEWFRDLQRVAEGDGGNSIVRSAPRGHAKTTLWDFVFPTWAGVYKKKLYILIISDAYDQAQGFISNIKDELENNERILEDFGNLKGKVWQEGSIICSNGVKIEALGAGMKIRGRKNRARRPDLIILDDIENDENTATQEQRTKLKNWYTKAVRHAGAKYTDFVIIGTVIHEESLLAELLKAPGYDSRIYKAVVQFAEREDLWAQWKDIFTDLSNERRTEDAWDFFQQNREEMLKGAKILWESGNPKFPRGYYDLMVLRVTDGEAAFASEMQNDPGSASDKFFQPITYGYDELPPLNQLNLVMAIDPSMGQSDKSDYSAIIVLGMEKKTGQGYVLEADIKRRHPDLIIEAMITHFLAYREQGARIRIIGIEDVQFQAFFKSEAKRRAKERGLHLPIQPIRNTVNKELRIESMEPSINNGYVKIHQSHTLLLQQLSNFPRAKKDGPDALEMAIRIATQGKKSSKSVGKIMRRARMYG